MRLSILTNRLNSESGLIGKGATQRFISMNQARFCFILITVLVLFCSVNILLVGASENAGDRSWIEVDVQSFDGESITARIVLKSLGNHEKSKVRVYGEIYSSEGSSIKTSVGRIIREVEFSSDTNITTFSYAARFSSTYQANKFLGLLIFPWDEHKLILSITTDFKADVDQHIKTIDLPTNNYEGFFYAKYQSKEDSQYTYRLDLDIKHPESFQYTMVLWTWGLATLFSLVTIFLILLSYSQKIKSDMIIAASLGLIGIIITSKVAVDTSKTPLGLVLSDIIFFGIILVNMMLVVVLLKSRKDRIYRSDEIRRLDAMLTECTKNLETWNLIVEAARDNQKDPKIRKYPTDRLRKSSIELLVTTRYVDEDHSFFKLAEEYSDAINSRNAQLNNWSRHPDATEKWLLGRDKHTTEIFKKFQDRMRTACKARTK